MKAMFQTSPSPLLVYSLSIKEDFVYNHMYMLVSGSLAFNRTITLQQSMHIRGRNRLICTRPQLHWQPFLLIILE